MQKIIAICLLAFASFSVSAQFTYHDLVPDAVVGKNYLHSWIDNPGFQATFESGLSGGGGGQSTHWDVVMFKFIGVGQVLYQPGSADYVQPLSVGDTVGLPGGNWTLPWGQYWAGALAFQNRNEPPIQPFYCRYAGFRWFSSGDTLYGWLAYEKDTVGASKVTLKAWAISTTPNEPLIISDHCIVGTEEQQGNPLEVQVFPNPAQDRVQVRLLGNRGTASIRVVDMMGRIHHQSSVVAEKALDLDVTGLAAGTYFVAVECNGKQVTQKLILMGRD